MSKKKAFMARQGDVLVWQDKRQGDASKGSTEIPREDGAIVLAHGEVTGHTHAIRVPGVCHLRAEGLHAEAVNVTALLVESDSVPLVHEEHDTIAIPAGRYHVIQQEEYTAEEYRNVCD
jgi:hypothetical protein